MEGLPVWNPSASEMLQEWMRRLNLICRQRIAILNKDAEHQETAAAKPAVEAATAADTEAAVFLSDEDSDLDEDLWEAAPFHTPPIATRVPMPLPGFGWGEGGFIPSHGFAQYPMHPALRAQVPVYQLQLPLAPLVLLRYQPPAPTRFVSPRLACGCSQVSTLETVLRLHIFEFFQDIITTELIEQLGMPPYPPHIAQ